MRAILSFDMLKLLTYSSFLVISFVTTSGFAFYQIVNPSDVVGDSSPLYGSRGALYILAILSIGMIYLLGRFYSEI